METTTRHISSSSSPCSSLLFHSHRHPWPLQNPTSPFSLNPYPPFHLPSCFRPPKSRPWDSNAENFRNTRYGFDFRDNGDGENGDEDDGVWSGLGKGNPGLFEEVLDSVWIFKAWSSYGWLLSGIVLSMLLAGGPKAFLMTLAIPLGQSAISLAFKKLSASTNGCSSKRKNGARKRRPSSTARTNIKMDGEEKGSGKVRKRKMGYQSWVAGGNGSVRKGGGDAPTFGGWEDLVEEEFNRGSVGRQQTGGPEWKSMEGGKFSRRKGRGEVPLLLRLLVAVFPFLGSWTKVL